MKTYLKVAFAALLTVAGTTAKAQDYSPKTGDTAVEVQFNPFNQNGKNFSIDGLKLRFFLNSTSALRVNASFKMSQKTTRADLDAPVKAHYDTEAEYDVAVDAYNHAQDNYAKNKATSLGLNVGYEFHYFRHGRLDLYAGAQLGMEKQWASYTSQTAKGYDQNASTGKYDTWVNEMVETSGKNEQGDRSSFAFKGGLFTGMDFFITQNLYAGVELMLDARHSSASDYTQKYVNYSTTEQKMLQETHKYSVKNKSFDVALDVVPQIRLGWKF